MDKDSLKHQIIEAIDNNRELIESVGDKILAAPELGFKEHKTADLVAGVMTDLGFEVETGLGLTGVKAVLKGSKPGPRVGLIGELDAVVVQGHPFADPENDAAHACGHNAQIAGLIGAMVGLSEAKVAGELAGEVVFLAVPAEEYVEIEERAAFREAGKIHFLGGKPELIRLGIFDDIDLVMMAHTASRPEDKSVAFSASSNGFIAKMVRFIGRAAHAGGNPAAGVNALYAANLSLAAINAQRETFRDEDAVRVHPIITKGGELVNVIPAEVTMETYIRGKNIEAILDAEVKFDRACRAGALALGAQVEIRTLPGFLPVAADPELTTVFKANCEALFGAEQCLETGHEAGSTDLGDISHLMPAIQPYFIGAEGAVHSAEWSITDKSVAYLGPAKGLALSAVDLLYGEAERGKEIIENHTPAMTKEEYLEFQSGLFRTEVFDGETGKSKGD